MRKAKKPLRSSGAAPMKSWKNGSTSTVRSSGQSIGPAQTFETSWSCNGERGHHAEVAAAASHRPEQIRVLVGVGGHEASVCQHHVDFEEVVDGETTLAGEVTDAAAERQAAQTRGRDDAARRRRARTHASHGRHRPGAAPPAATADGRDVGIDSDSAHARQVDDEAVVDAAQAAAIVAAAADGDVEALLASEPHRGDHVRDITTLDDHRWAFVDHRVVQRTSVVVAAVASHENVAPNVAAERIHCRRVESCCGHDGPRSVIRPARNALVSIEDPDCDE